MRKPKGIYPTRIPLVWWISILIVIPGLHSADQPADTIDSLIRRASHEGDVPLIVGLKVERYDQLVRHSRRFPTGIARNPESVRKASAADANLESAIRSAADHLLLELNGSGYELNHRYSSIPYLALRASAETLRRISASGMVERVFADRPLPLPPVWKSPLQPDGKPALNDSVDIVGADQAWSMGYTGSGWFVAILDTGIRSSHQFFSGKTIIEACYSASADCPNGMQEMLGNGAATHFSSLYYGYDHGSHVSGIAAGNNLSSLYGVARDAGILAVQIFSRFSGSDCHPYSHCVLSWNSDQLKGLDFVYANRFNYNIAAVNLSLGGDSFSSQSDCDNNPANAPFKEIFDNLDQARIAVIAASGNESLCDGINTPGCISSAVAIGATTKSDTETYFSNWSLSLLDLFAPGQDILSSVGSGNTQYERWNGTSMATPHVTGAWALIKQFGDLPTIEIKTALQDTGLSVQTRCSSSGSKARINVGEAILRMSTLSSPTALQGVQELNRSFIQSEYVNRLTWSQNPDNSGKNIIAYRVYYLKAGMKELLAEVDGASYGYLHRDVTESVTYTYGVSAVNNQGIESIATYTTVEPLPE